MTSTVSDELGHTKETFNKRNNKTSYTYDAMGRRTVTTYPDLTTDEGGYDNEGRRTSGKDRSGRTTAYEYDALGRLTKTTSPDSTFTTSTYDDAGRLKTSTDARGKTTVYTDDDAGRRKRLGKMASLGGLPDEAVLGTFTAGRQASLRTR